MMPNKKEAFVPDMSDLLSLLGLIQTPVLAMEDLKPYIESEYSSAVAGGDWQKAEKLSLWYEELYQESLMPNELVGRTMSLNLRKTALSLRTRGEGIPPERYSIELIVPAPDTGAPLVEILRMYLEETYSGEGGFDELDEADVEVLKWSHGVAGVFDYYDRGQWYEAAEKAKEIITESGSIGCVARWVEKLYGFAGNREYAAVADPQNDSWAQGMNTEPFEGRGPYYPEINVEDVTDESES